MENIDKKADKDFAIITLENPLDMDNATALDSSEYKGATLFIKQDGKPDTEKDADNSFAANNSFSGNKKQNNDFEGRPNLA